MLLCQHRPPPRHPHQNNNNQAMVMSLSSAGSSDPQYHRQRLSSWLSSSPQEIMDTHNYYYIQLALHRLRSSPLASQKALSAHITNHHAPSLTSSSSTLTTALSQYAASPQGRKIQNTSDTLRRLQLQLASTQKFVTQEEQTPRTARAASRLPSLIATIDTITTELATLQANCVEYQHLLSTQQHFDTLQESLGLKELQQSLTQQNRVVAQRRHKAGQTLEDIATNILPAALGGNSIQILRNVQLSPGAPHVTGELDLVAVDTTDNTNRVVAVVECKENPNDIGQAFEKLEPVLRWCAGNLAGPDWINKRHPKGHFTGVEHDGIRLTQESFQNTSWETILWFCTREKPLNGLSSDVRDMILDRISTLLVSSLLDLDSHPSPSPSSLLTTLSQQLANPAAVERATQLQAPQISSCTIPLQNSSPTSIVIQRFLTLNIHHRILLV